MTLTAAKTDRRQFNRGKFKATDVKYTERFTLLCSESFFNHITRFKPSNVSRAVWLRRLLTLGAQHYRVLPVPASLDTGIKDRHYSIRVNPTDALHVRSQWQEQESHAEMIRRLVYTGYCKEFANLYPYSAIMY